MTIKPQRYGVSSMPCESGLYVLHKDYLALEAEVERLREALDTPMFTGADAPMYGGIFGAEGANRGVAETAFYTGAPIVSVYYGEKRVFTSLAEFCVAHPGKKA